MSSPWWIYPCVAKMSSCLINAFLNQRSRRFYYQWTHVAAIKISWSWSNWVNSVAEVASGSLHAYYPLQSSMTEASAWNEAWRVSVFLSSAPAGYSVSCYSRQKVRRPLKKMLKICCSITSARTNDYSTVSSGLYGTSLISIPCYLLSKLSSNIVLSRVFSWQSSGVQEVFHSPLSVMMKLLRLFSQTDWVIYIMVASITPHSTWQQ